MTTLLSTIICTGPESGTANTERFLQGQLTIDVARTTNPQLFALCNVKGRALATGWVMKHRNLTTLVVASTLADQVITHLNQYGRFSQVAFEIGTDLAYVMPSKTLAITPELGLYVTQEIQDVSIDAQKQYLIHAGITLIEKESSEKLTPHMLGYPALGGVHFDKGCYLGQEIIARTEHLGQVKRTTMHGMVQGSRPNLLDPIMGEDGSTVGTITMVASTSKERHDVLMVLPITDGALHCAAGPITIL